MVAVLELFFDFVRLLTVDDAGTLLRLRVLGATAVFRVVRARVGDCVAVVALDVRRVPCTVALSRAEAFVDVRVRDIVVRLAAVGAAADRRVAVEETDVRRPPVAETAVRDLDATPRSLLLVTTLGPVGVITVRIRSGLVWAIVRRPKERRALGIPLPPPVPITGAP